MKHRIDIDDEVYDALAERRRGFEQPNDVLRRLLFLGDTSTSQPSQLHVGRLAPLMNAGLVKSGDVLRHERVRKGQVFTAAVTDDGLLRTNLGTYSAPSPALKDLVGTEIDGWRNWIHVDSGKTLDELRKSL
ncbi:hypothetical protein ACL02S_17225 [Nocardia sp. 004]|uniref:restriction system modified-DNA reader domain-containing protein n=1 Tax=Nocardia sp. 004 TaxID=3385978 RepID=UPI00399F63C8